MRIATLNNNQYYDLRLNFPYNKDLVVKCNQLTQKLTWKRFRYDGELKAWLFSMPDLEEVLRQFPSVEVEEGIYEDYIKIKTKAVEQVKQVQESKTVPLEFKFVNGEEPFLYQKIGVNFAIQNKKCGIFDEVRLGKLYQSAGVIYVENIQKVLVICTASPQTNWQRKLSALTGREANIVTDSFQEGLNILSYTGLQRFAQKIEKVKKGKLVEEWKWNDDTIWDLVVVDESHKTKSGKSSIRGALTEQVCKRADRVLLLTGTPMPTRPKDLLSQIRMMDKLEEFESEWNFLLRYCAGRKTRFGWDFSGSSHLDELNEKLSKFTIRRLRKDVWKDIPETIEDATYLDLPESNKYYELQAKLNRELIEANEYYKNTYKSLAGKNKLERAEVLIALKDDPKWKSLTSLVIVKIEKLKKELARQKVLIMPEILDEYVENITKVVVFSIHKEPVNKLHGLYKHNSVLITGDVDPSDRQDLIDKFNNHKDIIFAFVTMGTCNEGLDFSAANYVIHTELDWTPDNHTQASGRILNPEKKDPTSANYLVFANTIEDDIIEILLNKSKNIEKTVGGSMLTKIFNRMMEDNTNGF